MDEFATMKEIGVEFGITSHSVGRTLKELGYRTREGKPSQCAFREGLVKQKFTINNSNYLWAWDRKRTVALLERAGFVKAECRS